MNILVIGCGKLGAKLGTTLDKEGHDVSIIDADPAQFDRLPDDFSGYTFHGVPIDQSVLKEAGIEACDACAAVTSDDNMNLMACQIANDIFHVPRVLARIYDPRRGSIFRQFGIHTVCPTNLSSAAILSMLTKSDDLEPLYIDSTTVHFNKTTPLPHMIGRSFASLCAENHESAGIFGLLHVDGGLTLTHSGGKVLVREDDKLIYVRVAD